ncbi:MAG: hypothetical protein GX326_01190 [Clostridiaceae bacterium]|nr:hypothetical protein [Clostridiaceae bacterium]
MENIGLVVCYRLTKDSQFFNDSFKKYYYEIIRNDSYLEGLYFQIERNLLRLKVHENYLYSNGEPLQELSIPTKTRLGMIQSTKIIKKLYKAKHIYEGRINEEYIKHRFLFFAIDSSISDESKVILTFGFSKGNKEVLDVQTNLLSNESERLYNSYIINPSLVVLDKEWKNEQ